MALGIVYNVSLAFGDEIVAVKSVIGLSGRGRTSLTLWSCGLIFCTFFDVWITNSSVLSMPVRITSLTFSFVESNVGFALVNVRETS